MWHLRRSSPLLCMRGLRDPSVHSLPTHSRQEAGRGFPVSWQILPLFLIRLLQPQTQGSRSQVYMPNFGVPADYPPPRLSETLLEATWPPARPLFSRGHVQQTSFITRHLPFPCQAPLHLEQDSQDTQPMRVLLSGRLPPTATPTGETTSQHPLAPSVSSHQTHIPGGRGCRTVWRGGGRERVGENLLIHQRWKESSRTSSPMVSPYR